MSQTQPEWIKKAVDEIASRASWVITNAYNRSGEMLSQEDMQEAIKHCADTELRTRHAESDRLRKAAEALVARESIYSVHSLEFKELRAALSTPQQEGKECLLCAEEGYVTHHPHCPNNEQPQGQVGATEPDFKSLARNFEFGYKANHTEDYVENAIRSYYAKGLAASTPSLQKVREALKVASKDLHLSPTCAIGKVFQKECIRCQAERALPLLSQPQPQSEAGDKERADWYEKNHLTLTFEPGFNAWGTHQRITAGVVFNKKGKTWREAVDAMQAEKGVV